MELMHLLAWQGMSFPADLLEPRLVQSHSTVIIPLYKRIVAIRLLNCSEFSACQGLVQIVPASPRNGGARSR